ncbi:MAG: NAD(P)H-dependent oxidoreductase subunit E [Nitrospirae bacterium]|nr:NAD(P)H-dependent oxidoreductase subunit E [Nitrospirota bacterium]
MVEEGLSALAAILERCRLNHTTQSRPPNILQSLLAIQKALGSVPLHAVGEIAHALEVTEADVAGVLSYYPELRTRPPGRHLIRICIGESCVANHCDRVLAALRDALNIDVGETTMDGRFTVQRIYCVGNCAVGPSLMVDDDVHGRVAPQKVGELLNEYE